MIATQDPIISFDQERELFEYLAHGSLEHREWLKKAIISWNRGLAKPECDH